MIFRSQGDRVKKIELRRSRLSIYFTICVIALSHVSAQVFTVPLALVQNRFDGMAKDWKTSEDP